MLAKYVLVTAAFLLGGVTLGRAADQFPADTEFVRKAEQAGAQEIADSRGALAMSKDSAILAVAKRSLEDGTAANQRLAAISVEKGWPSPTLASPNTMTPYSDHRFVVRQIQARQEALGFYAEEAANGADTELQEFAHGTLPSLQRSLATLRSLRTS